MDIQELWDKARKQTEILRLQLQDLSTFDSTLVPYLFLAESSVNAGDTVVRRGHVLIERPAILLPGLSPQFEGFEFERDLQVTQDAVATFLLVRGVQFPSLRYRHQVSSLDVYEDSLQKAIAHFTEKLTAAEDVRTGLVVGPEEAWQFSLLLLTGALVVRSADGDLRRILDSWRKRQRASGSHG
jgi:hypothetical protein